MKFYLYVLRISNELINYFLSEYYLFISDNFCITQCRILYTKRWKWSIVLAEYLVVKVDCFEVANLTCGSIVNNIRHNVVCRYNDPMMVIRMIDVPGVLITGASLFTEIDTVLDTSRKHYIIIIYNSISMEIWISLCVQNVWLIWNV